MTADRRRVGRTAVLPLLAATVLLIAPGQLGRVAGQGAGVQMVPVEGEAVQFWSRWRGPSGQGVVNGAGYPDTWSATENVRWKTPVPGRGNSSPIVWRDSIFLTTAHEDGRLAVLAFRRSDGAPRWETVVPGQAGRSHQKNGHASATVSTDGARVYASFGSVILALTLDGAIVWRQDLGPIGNYHGPAGSPLLYRDRLIVYQDQRAGSFIAAFDTATGRQLWRTARQATIGWGTPVAIRLGTRDEIIVNSEGRVQSYDPAKGTELWACRGSSFEVIPTPVVGFGLVFCSSGRAGPTLAIRPGGSGDVSQSHLAWSSQRGSPFVPSPLLVGDQLYMVNDMASIVTAMEATTGRTLWQGTAGRRHTRGIFSLTGRGGRQGVLHQRRGRHVRPAGRSDLRPAACQPDGRAHARVSRTRGRAVVHSDGSAPGGHRQVDQGGTRPAMGETERRQVAFQEYAMSRAPPEVSSSFLHERWGRVATGMGSKGERVRRRGLVGLGLAVGLGVLAGTGLPEAQAPSAAERYWPQWRGPYATGISKTANPPTEWSETKNIRWKVPMPGRGTSTPVVWGDRLFVLTAVPVGVTGEAQHAPRGGLPTRGLHRFMVMAFDRATGKVVWERVAREQEPHEKSHNDNGTWASSSAITDGERVYAYFESFGLYVYDMNGKLLWEKDLGDKRMRNEFGEGSTPALHGNTLVIVWDHLNGDGSFIVALDKRDGKELWRVPRAEIDTWATPLILEVNGRAAGRSCRPWNAFAATTWPRAPWCGRATA